MWLFTRRQPSRHVASSLEKHTNTPNVRFRIPSCMSSNNWLAAHCMPGRLPPKHGLQLAGCPLCTCFHVHAAILQPGLNCFHTRSKPCEAQCTRKLNCWMCTILSLRWLKGPQFGSWFRNLCGDVSKNATTPCTLSLMNELNSKLWASRCRDATIWSVGCKNGRFS